ncbi:PEP-CTERM sorting domain-containing protein [Devosia sp.]|uniref:PEP-CTERM sorting domain-containing protein n=1 Tax=Devosia sp. TaxID=1871048 RepID=UPI002FC6BBAB
MKKHLLSLAAAAALLAAMPAHAISFNGVTGGDASVTDYSTDGLLSFDLDFSSFAPTTLSYTIDAADLLGGGLSFNAVLRNLIGAGGVGVEGYSFSLSSGLFGNLGTVTRQFGGTSSTSFSGSNALVSFSSLEFLDVEIGDPLGHGGGQMNWLIGGLNAGDSLSLTVTAVPEPETYALLLSGLGMVGWLTRRRRPQAQAQA